MSTVMDTWHQQYKALTGQAWSCPECDAETEPFEDNAVCETCHWIGDA